MKCLFAKFKRETYFLSFDGSIDSFVSVPGGSIINCDRKHSYNHRRCCCEVQLRSTHPPLRPHSEGLCGLWCILGVNMLDEQRFVSLFESCVWLSSTCLELGGWERPREAEAAQSDREDRQRDSLRNDNRKGTLAYPRTGYWTSRPGWENPGRRVIGASGVHPQNVI